ncbi:MAG: carotenoid biosynthesis protein [Rhodothermales bacterium]|nr:carotenoid biosynthesis protein [Rhodothermales bacterium]MBO6779782.1 carotenoid biosynthesis protein [Rhodothermales bacterium]
MARRSIQLLTAAVLFSLAGTFALLVFPPLWEVFGPWYETLVKAPTWTYMAVLPIAVALVYLPQLGASLLTKVFLWGTVIGAAAELIGTITGLPFGTYVYTGWLGPKIMGHVPWFIPLSWFAMGLVAFDLAGRLVRPGTLRVIVGAAFLTLWDVSLDPAMSKAFPFWVYPDGGFFYGMPLSNWGGWLLVSFIIMAGFEFLLGDRKPRAAEARYLYLINCLFPLGLSALYGLWGAVLAGAVATAVVMVSTREGAALARLKLVLNP